jgi:hypothetical protein
MEAAEKRFVPLPRSTPTMWKSYVRSRQPAVEIMELKVIGKEQVLSSSEHLESPSLSNGNV